MSAGSTTAWFHVLYRAKGLTRRVTPSIFMRRNPHARRVRVTINGSKAAIWAAITNIEKAAETISGIMSIEVVERPAKGLVGLKWRETRMLFGKPATAEKWITDAAENEFYKTRAESDGFVFLSTMSISEGGGGVTLTSSHDSSLKASWRGCCRSRWGFSSRAWRKRHSSRT